MGWSPELPQLIFYLWHLLFPSREPKETAICRREPGTKWCPCRDKAMYNFTLSVKCCRSGWSSGSQLVRWLCCASHPLITISGLLETVRILECVRSCLLHLPWEHTPSAHREDSTLCGSEARVCREANPTATWGFCERHMTHLTAASSKTKTQGKCNFFNSAGFSTLPNTSLNCSIIVYYHFGS